MNTDAVVLAELGRRLERTRLEQNMSQERVAHEAGVSRATIERVEAGAPIKSNSLVRILRALGRLEALDQLVPEPLPNPVERRKLQGRQRKRARARADREAEPGPWRWADEPDRRQ
jgi:transcriptional regulator with XRE-family HTH domain